MYSDWNYVQRIAVARYFSFSAFLLCWSKTFHFTVQVSFNNNDNDDNVIPRPANERIATQLCWKKFPTVEQHHRQTYKNKRIMNISHTPPQSQIYAYYISINDWGGRGRCLEWTRKVERGRVIREALRER